MLSGYVVSEFRGNGVIELTGWLKAAEAKTWYCLDMFTGFDFPKFRFTGSTLDLLNISILMARLASPYREVDSDVEGLSSRQLDYQIGSQFEP